MIPETTRQQAEELLRTDDFQPLEVGGRVLTARLVERGVQPVPRRVGAKTVWEEEPACEVVLEGGAWGPHAVRCGVSPPDVILGHWRAYRDAHLQHEARVAGLRPTATGTRFQAPTQELKVGDLAALRGFLGTQLVGRVVHLEGGRANVALERRGGVRVQRGVPVNRLTRLGSATIRLED